MTRIKLDSDLIKVLSLFQSLTRASVKDCVDVGERLYFIVEKDHMSRAIGKGGENVFRVEKSLNRKIKIVEFDSEVTKFVRNLIYPARANEIVRDVRSIVISPVDTVSRGRIIGRGALTLREYERITKRYFDIDEIKVV